jgi:hypothetical protein
MYLYRRLARNIERLFIVSGSATTQPAYAPLMRHPNKRIFTALTPETLSEMNGLLSDTSKRTMIFLDDVTASRSLNDMDKGMFAKFCFNARWLNTHIMCCTHKITAVSAALRESADDIFMLSVNRLKEREIAHNEFGADLIKKDFLNLYGKAISKPHGFLYIHRGAKTNYKIGL